MDAPAGPGPRTWSYLVPPGMDSLEPGEVVLVPFGRGGRQSIGIVIGPGIAASGTDLRPLAAVVRTDGPVPPMLSLSLAGWIAEHYLAPLAVVIRAMLPPGMLERTEARGRGDARGGGAPGAP